MPPRGERLPDEAAQAIWRRAAQLQAESERRLEERTRQLAAPEGDAPDADGLHPDDIRAAAEEAGIAPEFVQIAMAEAAASPDAMSPVSRWDLVGARFFLASSRRTIEVSAIVAGPLDAVAAAVLQVFSGHPCLLQTGEVAEMSSSGRVIVFNVPRFDWGATANPPFIEKAAMIGLRQLHVAIRPIPEDPSKCEVVVAGDLLPGMRKGWRWSAATSVAGSAAGGAFGLGIGATMMTGAVLALPLLAGAAAVSGAAVGLWAASYRWYRSQVETALQDSLRLLPTTTRAIAANQGQRELPSPRV